MRLSRADLHALTGAYAVDAIDDELERDRFERHVRRCQQCTGEVRDLTATATRLAFAASRPPPPDMRANVLTAVSQTRQLAPVVEHPSSRLRSARDLWTGRFPMLSYAFAAACVGVAVVLLVVLIGTRHQLDRAQARNAALTAVLNAPDSHAVTQTTNDGGHATLVYSLRRHAMIFTSHGLPPPPPGKVYELWLIGPPHVRPAGLLGPGEAGRAGPILRTGVEPRDIFGITIEPAGGTPKPTTTPILLIALHA
jgi:anti-sigma-K factor RskA